MYSVHRIPVTVILQGEIRLVVSPDGAPIPPERILGQTVDSDKFQNAQAFLDNGGRRLAASSSA